MSNALQLFRAGHDYIAIAAHFGTSEAIVEKAIHYLRGQEIADHEAREKKRQSARKQQDRTRSELRAIRGRQA